MAVVSVQEIWNGRTGDLNAKLVREYLRVYRVQTDSKLDDQVIVMSATGLPRLYDIYLGPNGAYDTGAIVSSGHARQEDNSPFFWIVEVKYSSEVGENRKWDNSPEQARDQTQNQNPLYRPPSIKWSGQEYQRPIQEAAEVLDGITHFGNAIVNSAGEMFDPAAEVQDANLTLVIGRNEPLASQDVLLAYMNVVNSDYFMGWPPGTALMKPIEYDSNFENGLYYFKATYTIHFRSSISGGVQDDGAVLPIVQEGWILKPLDQGYAKLVQDDQGDFHNVPIRVQGQPITAPQLLDGTGQVLPIGDPPVFRKFRVYPSMPFAPLRLPFPWF